MLFQSCLAVDPDRLILLENKHPLCVKPHRTQNRQHPLEKPKWLPKK